MRRIFADDLPYNPKEFVPENFAGDRCVHDPNEPNPLLDQVKFFDDHTTESPDKNMEADKAKAVRSTRSKVGERISE